MSPHELSEWSITAYRCAHDESLLKALVDSLLSHGAFHSEVRDVLQIAWERANAFDSCADRKERLGDAIGYVESLR